MVSDWLPRHQPMPVTCCICRCESLVWICWGTWCTHEWCEMLWYTHKPFSGEWDSFADSKSEVTVFRWRKTDKITNKRCISSPSNPVKQWTVYISDHELATCCSSSFNCRKRYGLSLPAVEGMIEFWKVHYVAGSVPLYGFHAPSHQLCLQLS